jgi:hypothetical protein
MSGTTIIASTLPVSVLCTGTTHAEGVEPYSIPIVGERDPYAVHGQGITYDVDTVAFNEWIGLNAGLVDSVRPVTQAEVDAMQDVQDQYGFELGLVEDGGTLAAGGMTVAEARTAAQVAAQRVRQADAQIRDAETQRRMADQQTEAATAAREVAEKAQRDALQVVEEKQQARPAPTQMPAPPAPRPEQHPA